MKPLATVNLPIIHPEGEVYEAEGAAGEEEQK